MTSQLLARFFPDHPSDASDRSPIVDAVAHLLHDSKNKNKPLRCYLGHRIQTPFIHRSSLVHERFNDRARVDLTAGRVIGM